MLISHMYVIYDLILHFYSRRVPLLIICCNLSLLYLFVCSFFFFFSSRRRHTRCSRDWSSDVCSSDLQRVAEQQIAEFVMDAGYGTREQRQDGKANADDRKKEDPDDQCFACG